MRQLDVFIGSRQIGQLQESDNIWRFRYTAEWAQAPDGFDLSPALPRTQLEHLDGSTVRPVQWYFDNLLPEELLRQTIAKEAGLRHEDEFALLEYLGAESAGSLTLLAPGSAPPTEHAWRPLAPAELSRRIADLPTHSLTRQAPKRMSFAGAQHKLLIVMRGVEMFEPVGATPSTHILKPEHPQTATYPASVLNEYLTMEMGRDAGLQVPPVRMGFVPQPVYVIERFDREGVPSSNADPAVARRLHIIDACQLLNKARTFKHSGASLESLQAIVERTTNKVQTRLRLFQWLAFNVLVANDDAHLKNLSFMVSADGISLAPHYDLLSTGAYHTKALADEHARWPAVPMAIALTGAKTFGEVTREKLLKAGEQLGVPKNVAGRLLASVVEGASRGFLRIRQEQAQYAAGIGPNDGDMRARLAQQERLLRVIEHITFSDMTKRLG